MNDIEKKSLKIETFNLKQESDKKKMAYTYECKLSRYLINNTIFLMPFTSLK